MISKIINVNFCNHHIWHDFYSISREKQAGHFYTSMIKFYFRFGYLVYK